MKKAVSPVITLVLLLILSLGAVSAAYYWMSYMQTGLQETGGSEAERTTSTRIPFSIISHICDSNTDKFTFTVFNNGPEIIKGDTLFVLTVSDINGVNIGFNGSMGKNTNNDIPANGAFTLEATIQGLDIELYDEYSLKITSGTSIQTIICNAQ